MSNVALRFAAAVLTSVAMAAAPALTQPLPVAASAGGTLYGLGPHVIGAVDPVSGSFTPLANLPGLTSDAPAPSFYGLAADAAGHRLFTDRQLISDFSFTSITYQLITVDTQTGSVTLSGDQAQAVTDMKYDPVSGALFGVTNMCCPFQLVRIDPATGAETHITDLPGVQESPMTINPATGVIFMTSESFVLGQFQPVVNLLTIDESTGAITTSPQMNIGVFMLAYDTSSNTLFGKTFCCPATLASINVSTGAVTRIGGDLGLGEGFAIDSSSHNIYTTSDQLGAFAFNQFVETANDQSGTATLSSGALPSDTFVSNLVFVAPAITPDSIKADVISAFAANHITSAGVEKALLSELGAASAARSRGQCQTASAQYQAFIHTVRAQSGETIAAATANQLVSEAEFLQANCP